MIAMFQYDLNNSCSRIRLTHTVRVPVGDIMRPTGHFEREGQSVRNLLLIVALLITSLLFGCLPKPDSAPSTLNEPITDPLRLTIVPYEAAEQLREGYTPMAQFLAKKLG